MVAELYAPATHPLAEAHAIEAAQLDGHRLLTWNPPGTAFTDLLLARLAAAGAVVEPVTAQVTGGTILTDLIAQHAVALLPTGWPPSDGIATVPLQDEITLPLTVLWPHGTTPPAVERLRHHMPPPT